MSEPDLAITVTLQDTYETVWTDRLLIRFADMTTEFDAWSAWASASGSADQQQWAADYTGYVMVYEYENTDGAATDIGGGLQVWKDWKGSGKDKNGWCLRDMTGSLGGTCLFPV